MRGGGALRDADALAIVQKWPIRHVVCWSKYSRMCSHRKETVDAQSDLGMGEDKDKPGCNSEWRVKTRENFLEQVNNGLLY